MDNLSPERRSENMRRIRGKNTAPEVLVRRIVRELGYSGYRLHRNDITGKPDIAWLGKKVAIFVHGCFWHAHECAEGVRKPKSNVDYWIPKLQRNRERDRIRQAALIKNGWKALVVWECELADHQTLKRRLRKFLETALH
jgi:DNA mismatch endonuclease, patch repair protein